jgi:hypothetical protein
MLFNKDFRQRKIINVDRSTQFVFFYGKKKINLATTEVRIIFTNENQYKFRGHGEK